MANWQRHSSLTLSTMHDQQFSTKIYVIGPTQKFSVARSLAKKIRAKVFFFKKNSERFLEDD
jgi:hypothetical protein